MKKVGISWIVFGFIALVFLFVKISASDYSVSDENIYYKMGELVANGSFPYTDFFFAHPPLQIYLYATVFTVFGFNFLILKMLSALAMVVAAGFVFGFVKEKINANVALGSVVIFLFSYGTLLFSNFPTGTEFATALIAGSFYFFVKKKFALSGILIGLGAVTAQLSLIALPVMVGAAFFLMNDRKGAVKLFAWFLGVFSVISGLFLLIARGEYINQVIIYHLQKPAMDVDKASIFLRILKTNAPIFAIALIGIISNYKKKALVVPVVIALGFLLAFPLLKTAFNYYLLYAFPFLAIIGAYGLVWIYKLFNEKIKFTKEMSVGVIVVVLLASGFFSLTQFNNYELQDFKLADEVSQYIEDNSNPDQTIFGDDSTVPLLSLLSGREIALNYIDNNNLRYTSGVTNIDDTISLLADSNLKFLITRSVDVGGRGTLDFSIAALPEFYAFVFGSCELAEEFKSDWQGLEETYSVYDCSQ
jgi:hypothetical protein